MNQSFNIFDQYEIPTYVLCNPDKTQLYALGDIYDRTMKLRFNALSEISFTAQSKINTFINGVDENIDTPYFDFLDYLRLIYVENIGYFMITQIDEDNTGIIHTKKITAFSLEIELSQKKLSIFKGTYKFYDLVDPAGTLLEVLLNYAPLWTIDDVDSSLCSLYRTFDITDTNIYQFLMNEVSQTYQAIFTFDIINRKISAHTPANATTNTDIYLSYDNLVENTNIKAITEELVTSLNVFGGGNLSIRQVNPLGTDSIYNFDYYKTMDWMSAGLISALNTWETKITNNQSTYATLLTNLKEKNAELLAKESALVTLQGELTALEEVQKVRIQQGLDISAINTQILAKESEISAQETAILNLEDVMSWFNAQLEAINDDLSFENNFTAAQVLELQSFIIGSTYTNSNFIQTDSMSGSAIQEMAQTLYDQAVQILDKVSQPRYMFDISTTNFLFLKEFQAFITQLVLGAVITIEIKDGTYTQPALLGIDYSYDNPNEFKLIFSNRLRLDDSAFQFSDLFSQSIDTGITANFNSENWNNWTTHHKNDVTTFITSALDASKNAVVNATNQNFIIDSNGLRGRYLDPDTNEYDPKQMWLINNVLAFTKDNWDTASLALGEILTPSGTMAYGLVAEVLVGNLIAGNELIIQNDNNTFLLNGSGATLTDATFTLNRSDGKSRIIINPEIGIEIDKRNPTTGSYARNFYIDVNGNIVFTGNLQGASGTFSGAITATSGKIGAWTIDQWGLKDDAGNYIYGDGRVRLGKLTIYGSTATFDGNIYAKNLQGFIYGNQLRNINANTITSGCITGINIYGSNIYWPGVKMYSPFAGYSTIEFDTMLSLTCKYSDSFINVTQQNGVTLGVGAGKSITLNSNAYGAGIINLFGDIRTSNFSGAWGWGKTETILVNTPIGDKTLNFVNGLLTTQESSISGSGLRFGDFGWSFVMNAVSGVAGYIEVPYDCTITAARLVGDVLGNAVVDIWSCPYTSYPPSASNSIVGGNYPTLSSAIKYEDTGLSGWTINLNKGDWLAININSSSVVTKLTLSLMGVK